MKCKRRQWTKEEKDEILQRIENGESVSEVASEIGVAPPQIYIWRKQREQTLKHVDSKIIQSKPNIPLVPFKQVTTQFDDINQLKQALEKSYIQIDKLKTSVSTLLLEKELQRLELE